MACPRISVPEILPDENDCFVLGEHPPCSCSVNFFFFFLQILLLQEILIHSRNFFESIVELAFFLSGAILWGAETLFGEKKTGKSAGNEKNP